MTFWHDDITGKSFATLQELRKNYSYVLIGGWAVWLYTKALKSKDIDLIVDYAELERMKHDFTLVKNDRLKKYEIRLDAFDIDVYVPHYSRLGLPVEAIPALTQSLEGFTVPLPEALLLMKLAAYENRQGTAKGRKDELDVFSLLAGRLIDFKRLRDIAASHGLADSIAVLNQIVGRTAEAPELGLNRHQFSRMKRGVVREEGS